MTHGQYVYVCTRMPYYRVELAPVELRYRNGVVILETVRDGDDWVWRATKSDGTSIHLLRRPTLVAFARDRYEGFEVPAGSAADLVMQRLVREGNADLTVPGKVHVRSLRSSR